jgi:arsenate reductase
VTSPDTPPVVLYACVHNSGRSVAAKLLTEHYAGGRLEVRSAGSEPTGSVNAEITAVLSERGISTGSETPTRLTAGVVENADVVVSMGCGETCPIFPGKRYLDWDVEDPAGRDRKTVRRIVDEIDRRVRKLLVELGVERPTET